MSHPAIVITGAAGLLGQNLIVQLREHGMHNLVCIDKHRQNLLVLRSLHPDICIVEADMAQPGSWQEQVAGASAVVVGQAQIGGLEEAEFVANNVTATQLLLDAATAGARPYLVHISSSVVNSMASDFYTESKKQQEFLVRQSGLDHCVLRPTLMFGWFDRKHLGWLARFMRRSPVFPIPGSGRYLRQPLYVQDFCAIVRACLAQRPRNCSYNISGQEMVHYIDLIRSLKRALSCRTLLVRIPYGLFWWLLRTYSMIDGDPPFTTKQLEALVTPDEFEVIDWPALFSVPATPLERALLETFSHPRYSRIALEF